MSDVSRHTMDMYDILPSNSEDDVINIAHPDYDDMRERWELPCALVGGTLTMRDGGSKWLPQEEKEKKEMYDRRLARSILYEGYKDALVSLSARPFSRPVTWTPESPIADPVLQLLTHPDKTEVATTQFLQEVTQCGIHFGKTHLLADYPIIPAGATQADEEALKARPVLVHVSALAVFNWRTQVVPATGEEELTEVRIAFQEIKSVGSFKLARINFIRVYTKTTWEIYEQQEIVDPKTQQKVKKYVSINRGTHNFGRVPLYTLYINRIGFMKAYPALEGLAWTNLAHWQSFSDQRNILRFTRLGILFASGFTEEEVKAGITLSPSGLTSSSSDKARLEYVESTGSATSQGKQDVDDLEIKMGMQALDPLVSRKTGGAGATGRALDEAKTQSQLQLWVRAAEVVFTEACVECAAWIKKPLPAAFKVNIYSDFAITMRVRDDVLALIEMRGKGQISHELLLSEVKRRGLIDDTRDIAEEVTAAKADPPPTGVSGTSRIGGTGGGSRQNLNDTNGGKSGQKGAEKDPITSGAVSNG